MISGIITLLTLHQVIQSMILLVVVIMVITISQVLSGVIVIQRISRLQNLIL